MIIVAHRMPPDAATAAALARAGAAMFELDVLLPPGGGPAVVTHFGPLGPRAVLLYNDGWRVRRARPWSRLGPSLAQAVDLLPPACEVVLDLKGPIRDAAAAGRELAAEVPHPQRTHLCGNVGPIAAAVSELGMRVWRSVGTRAELAATLNTSGPPPWAVTVRHTMLSAGVLDRLRQRTPRVLAWTVNSVQRALDLRSLGVDGVTTDRPAVMTALRAEGR